MQCFVKRLQTKCEEWSVNIFKMAGSFLDSTWSLHICQSLECQSPKILFLIVTQHMFNIFCMFCLLKKGLLELGSHSTASQANLKCWYQHFICASRMESSPKALLSADDCKIFKQSFKHIYYECNSQHTSSLSDVS